MQQNNLTPFACSYTPNIPELLLKLNCSIAITTYQAGKIIFLSAKDENKLSQLPRTFDKPMGIAYNEERGQMGIACKDSIELFQNSTELAQYYPNGAGKYDALFMPRVSYQTGALDIHDLRFGNNNEIYGVNTLFSCLVKFDNEFSFTPYWKPNFVTEIKSEDRCHLNGMVMESGKPKYVTAFNTGNSHQSWRENITKTGVLIDVDTNEIVANELGMPHSPMLINGKLYVLLSATGQLIEINPDNGEKREVINLESFVRGLGHYNDYLFIGISKLRQNSSTFAKLDIAQKANQAGVAIVHLPTGALCGKIMYHNSVDEIYDVEVIPNFTKPNILNKDNPISKQGVTIPGSTFWARTEETNTAKS